MEALILEERKLFLEKEPEERILYRGYAFCPACERLIPANLVLKEEYTYHVRDCLFCKRSFEKLLFKMDVPGPDAYPKRYNFPSHWPRVEHNLPLGYKKRSENYIEEFKIINFQNVPYIVLFLTKRCNLDCPICFDKVAEDREEMDIGEIKNILKDFKHMPVVLFGGEPTVRDDLAQIIFLIRASGNFPVLFTNGVKLANRDYLLKLKRAGLWDICFSLDGFSYEVESKIREISREAYLEKLLALENLTEEKMKIRIHATILKGVNEDEIPWLLEYASRNPQISELWLRPMCLGWEGRLMGTDNKDILISVGEIQRIVSNYLGIEREYFLLWRALKWALTNFFKKNLPLIKMPVFVERMYSFKKKDQKILPLFKLEELREMVSALENKRLDRFLRLRYSRWIFSFLKKFILQSSFVEFNPRKDIFRVVTKELIDLTNFCPETDSSLICLRYFPRGRVSPGLKIYCGELFAENM